MATTTVPRQPARAEPRSVSSRLAIPAGLVDAAALFLFAALLWVPFGLQTTGLAEEWGTFSLLDRGGRIFWIGSDTPMPEQRIRPLTVTLYALAYHLTPDSFVAVNAMVLLLFFGKGVALYAVLRALAVNRPFSLIAGALCMVYPADSGLFSLRVVHGHGAVFCLTAAFFLLIKCWQTGRVVFGAGSAALLLVSAWQYEAGFLLQLALPLLLVSLDRGFTRRNLAAMAWWYLACAVTLVYVLLVLRSPTPTYQASHVTSSFGLTDVKLVAYSWLRAYQAHVWTAWRDSFRLLLDAPAYLWLAAVGAAAVVAAGLFRGAAVPAPADRRSTMARYGLMALFGAACIGLGFGVVAFSPALRGQDFRVFYFSAGGATVAAVAVCYLVGLGIFRRPAVAVALAAVLLFAGTLHALNQHERYWGMSQTQQRVLGTIARVAPAIDREATLLVVDEAGYLQEQSNFLWGMLFPAAVGVLYRDPNVSVDVCYPQWLTWDVDRCSFGEKAVSVSRRSRPGRPPATYDYDRLLVLVLGQGPTGQIELREDADHRYVPAGATTYRPPGSDRGFRPARAEALLGCWPRPSCAPVEQAVRQRVYLEFDETPLYSLDWKESETNIFGTTFRWSTSREARVNIGRLTPGDKTLRLRVLFSMRPDIFESVQVTVNGRPLVATVSVDRDGARTLTAAVPAALLDQNADTVVSVVVGDLQAHPSAPPPLGVAVDWLDIRSNDDPLAWLR